MAPQLFQTVYICPFCKNIFLDRTGLEFHKESEHLVSNTNSRKSKIEKNFTLIATDVGKRIKKKNQNCSQLVQLTEFRRAVTVKVILDKLELEKLDSANKNFEERKRKIVSKRLSGNISGLSYEESTKKKSVLKEKLTGNTVKRRGRILPSKQPRGSQNAISKINGKKSLRQHNTTHKGSTNISTGTGKRTERITRSACASTKKQVQVAEILKSSHPKKKRTPKKLPFQCQFCDQRFLTRVECIRHEDIPEDCSKLDLATTAINEKLECNFFYSNLNGEPKLQPNPTITQLDPVRTSCVPVNH